MNTTLTETRAMYLAKVATGGWTRKPGGPTTKGGNAMPEPVWMFLVENGLATISVEDITITRRGQRALDAYG